jgi:transglutaminase-like putative cysteine protease
MSADYGPYPDHFLVPDTTSPEHRMMMVEDLVAFGARDPDVIAYARQVVAASPANPLQALLDGMHARVTYYPDCGDGNCEDIQRPAYTLFGIGRGDCEDMSMAFASMARAMGYTARAVWLPQPGANNHVPAQICGTPPHAITHTAQVIPPENGPSCESPNGWVWVETTLPGARVGEHPYEAAERLGVIRRDLVGGVR